MDTPTSIFGLNLPLASSPNLPATGASFSVPGHLPSATWRRPTRQRCRSSRLPANGRAPRAPQPSSHLPRPCRPRRSSPGPEPPPPWPAGTRPRPAPAPLVPEQEGSAAPDLPDAGNRCRLPPASTLAGAPVPPCQASAARPFSSFPLLPSPSPARSLSLFPGSAATHGAAAGVLRLPELSPPSPLPGSGAGRPDPPVPATLASS